MSPSEYAAMIEQARRDAYEAGHARGYRDGWHGDGLDALLAAAEERGRAAAAAERRVAELEADRDDARAAHYDAHHRACDLARERDNLRALLERCRTVVREHGSDQLLADIRKVLA
jgi:hypothetical protein